MVVILTACRREILQLPDDIRSDLADALARLDAGHTLTMPLPRPLPSIGRGVDEHALKKTTQATPRNHIELVRKRIKEDVR
jgi:phage-related protein